MSMDGNELYAVATGAAELTPRTIHVRVAGRSHDLSLRDLSIHEGSADSEIKAAVSQHLDVPLENFKFTIVERHEGGNMTLRPEAVFGGEARKE